MDDTTNVHADDDTRAVIASVEDASAETASEQGLSEEPTPGPGPVQPELAYEAADASDAIERLADAGPEGPAEAEVPDRDAGDSDTEEPMADEAQGASEGDGPTLDEMVASLQAGDAASEEPAVGPEAGAAESGEADVSEETPAPEAPIEAPAEVPAKAPATTGAPAVPIMPLPVQARTLRVTRVPFWLHAAVWALFAGTMTVLLWPVSADPFTTRSMYTWFVIGGAVLTAAGPILGLIVWLVVRARTETGMREALTRAILLRAASSTAAGVVMWWLALALLDLHRAGLLG